MVEVPGDNKIAEVVETSSTAFVAQCYELYGAPPLGFLLRAGESHYAEDTPPSRAGFPLRAGESPAYAVLQNVATGALDPGRRVMPRGADEERDEDVYRNNPQLARLLGTRMEALIVGYREGETPHQGLPPSPPKLHSSVHACGPEEVAAFTRRLDFLHLLVDARTPAVDEVIVACLKGAAGCHPDPGAFLTAAGRSLALELGSDLGRLNAILRRLSP